MSRCYPFPPPGFVPNRVRNESLIEPIKKGTKEEVKRDRKHKEDKKKRKDRDSEDGRSRKHLRHHKRQRKDYEIANASKKVEFLEEKSCLTMELENQSSSGSESQPLNGRHNDSETSIDKGQKYPEVMMTTNKDQKQCSSRDSLDASHAALCEYGEKEETNRQFSMQLGKEKGVSSHGPSKLCSKCPPSTAMRFLKLIENWAPPDRFETKLLADSEDQELWLLMKVGAKRHHQVSDQASSEGSSSMVWEAAQFLPEAELHALPFTVPF